MKFAHWIVMSEEWISKQIYKTEWRAVLKLFNIIFDKCMEERSEIQKRTKMIRSARP